MSKVKVSVIVPAYNAEKYIERCINSLISQIYSNLEILVVDDGSKDNTPKLLDELASKDDRIFVTHKVNEGVSIARNVALSKVTGEYVLFTDSDDWLENDMVEKLVNSALDNNSDIVICGFNNYYESEKRFEKKLLNNNNHTDFLTLITDDTTNYGGFPWNKLIKSSRIVKYYNESIHYFENLLFFLENFQDEVKYSVVNEPLYNYSINDTSALHSKKYSEKKISSLDALYLVIPLLPKESIDFHKFIFINSYYENYYYLKKLNKLELLDKYKNTVNSYYKEIHNSKYLSKKTKIKLFILKRLTFIYLFRKKMN